MQVIIDEIVTEVVVEGGQGESDAATVDPQVLRELVLQILREELERHERHEDGPTWR